MRVRPNKTIRSHAVQYRAIAVSVIILLSAAGGVSCSSSEAPDSKRPPVNVTVEQIRPIPKFADVFVLPGIIHPKRVVDVSAEVAGRIEVICCQEGDPAKRGGDLIFLNTDLLQAEFDQAKAQSEFDQREFDRIAAIRERSSAAVTAREYSQARATAEVAKALSTLAKAKLERAKIVAPIDGVLDKLPVEVGEYIQPGMAVARIVDISTVEVVVDVPERDVHLLRMGQSVTISIDALDGLEVTGEISYISELADQFTRTTRVEVSVDNPIEQDGRRTLRSGQIVRARITRRVLENVVMIPLGSVIPLENSKVVYVVEDGKAARRQVRLGLLKGNRVQVIEGLSEGDMLILAGSNHYVGPGQVVRIAEEVLPDAAKVPPSQPAKTN